MKDIPLLPKLMLTLMLTVDGPSSKLRFLFAVGARGELHEKLNA